MAENSTNGQAEGPLDRLKSEATELIGAFGDRAASSLREKVEDATGRLTEYTKGAATPAVKAAVSGGKSLAEGKGPVRSVLTAGATAAKEKIGNMFSKGGGGGNLKVTNMVESIDVGVPVKLAYDQWTQFTDFPSFMKKVEDVGQEEEQKLTWKAQVLWSHRTWESTILEQVPDEKIIWRSRGDKGYVDGAVTFHELAPNLTRILVTLEYYPKGFFEHVGNLWRAQGRRMRLELKHYRRHVMTEVLLHPEDVEGWRGVISDGEVQDQGKQKSTKGGRQKEADGGKGTRSRRAPSASRTASGSRRSGGSSQRSGSAGGGSRPGSSSSSGSRTAPKSKAASGNGRSRVSTGKRPAAAGRR